ncbi:MAG: DUF4129 domain-containing protein [Planctomycetota bacterium]
MELVGVLLLLFAGPDQDAVESAQRAVFERGGYQATIPGRTARETSGGGSSTGREPDRRDRDSSFDPAMRHSIGTALLWVFAIVLAALALLWAFTALRERQRWRGATEADPGDVEVPHRPVPVPLLDPETLARAGDYTGAIHATLLQVVAKYADRLRPAWTTREVARAIPHAEFMPLAEMVERTLFGGRPASDEEYRQARAWAAACVPERGA